ncbi:MAG: hypothetical protein ACJ764_00015 [Solirubrobacteraceae bacterium]
MRRSRLSILLVSSAVTLLAPAAALGDQSLGVFSDSGFPAGGHPTYSTQINLDTTAGSPSSVTVKLAPGVLASPAANPSCVRGTAQHTATCQIGTGSVDTSIPGLALPFTAYLAPPPSKADVVGIDVVTAVPGLPVTHAGGKLVQTPRHNVQTVLSLSLSGLGLAAQFVTGMTLTVNGTLDGKPFNRMPTNCSPGPSQLSVVYAKRAETVTAVPDFAPTGCRKLPYAPRISGTATANGKPGGGRVVTTITQAVGQAASARTTLTLPSPTVGPNPGVLSLQNSGTPVGSVVADSPLLPTPLRGRIFLTGSFQKPRLLFKFPPPAALTLTGIVDLSHNAVTIPAVPDVPLTRLQVTFPGGAKSLLAVSCAGRPASLKGAFTAQSGKTAMASARLTVTGCS